MKAISLALSMALMLPALVLAEKGDKGPSDKAYESASEKASFKREDGKPGKGGKEKQKGHSHDGEYHEHDKQDSDAEDSQHRRTEQEQEQVRERIQEKVQTEQRETGSESAESASSGGETSTREERRPGLWQRLLERRDENKAADGN